MGNDRDGDVIGDLGKVARGGAIALVGLVIAAIFGFLVRAVIGRVYGPHQYGVYNLVFTVFTIALVIVMLGFPTGIQREVSYFTTKHPKEDVKRLISTAISIVIVTSLTGTLVLEIIRDFLPRYIGGGSLLPELLEILSISLPVSALLNVSIAISQGFKRVREYVFYGRVLVPVMYFVLVALVSLVFRVPIRSIMVTYILAQALGLSLLVRDLRRFGILPKRPCISVTLAKRVTTFSLPLLVSGIIGFIMSWTDTLMLGHYLGSTIVGIYNAAAPMSRFIPVFLAAFTVIYNPIATELYARDKLKELSQFYTSVTKWVVLLTFPLFLILVSYPKPVIMTLFGGKYVGAWRPLTVLSIGFMFHSIVGPNGLTLISIGKPAKDMTGNVLGATLNVVMNILLIPKYGMMGAAMATATAYVVANLYKSILLFKLGISPLTWRYMKVLILGVGIAMTSTTLPASALPQAVLWTIISSLAFYCISVTIGAFDRNDVELMKMVSRRVNIVPRFLMDLLERFSR